ncbi:hypothetical protein [Coleofasciculus sp. FACHB-501]|uniref:hypothetical protein n=1 Tax=Cyanophyceae TaxID=3028117 RepID=UPI00168285D9|nr:hypothetical protein [Coleofasciculus sp. FACHB-501]MBD1837222.1 hypothetical protein [Coleofasciculus sp. FACHB-501]
MKIISINPTPEIEGKPSFSATSARSPHAPAEQSPFTLCSNLSQGAIEKQSRTTTERSQRQDSAKASKQQQLQEAISLQRLTDCLEHIESLGFLGEQTQLLCLNLAQCLQGGCGV